MSGAAATMTALERAIRSEPNELQRVLDMPIAHDSIERLRQAHHIWLVGTGTSQHAAELGASMFRRAGTAAAMSSMHFVNWAPPIDPRDAVILISHNAGAETAYAWSAYTMSMNAGLRVLAITRRGRVCPRPSRPWRRNSRTPTRSATRRCSWSSRGWPAVSGPSPAPPISLPGSPTRYGTPSSDRARKRSRSRSDCCCCSARDRPR